MTTHQSRQPKGIPVGGQFATSERAEAGATLLAPANEHPVVLAAIERAKQTGVPVRIDSEALPGCSYDPGENSSACGDNSLGVEPSNRATWATGLDHEPFVTVTETFYVIGRRDDGTHDLDYDAWQEAKADIEAGAVRDGGWPSRIRYGVERQSEWIAHTDVDDPSATEVRSDYHYDPASAITYTALDRAEGAARGGARHVNWDRDYAVQNWK